MTTVSQIATALGDRYRIEREVGAGGMATVFLATDLKHDRAVAIKVLKPELAAGLGAERFLQEIRIAAKLDHPHILTLIDSGKADGMLYYVLPFVRGESLRARLDREHQLRIEDAIAIARQIAGALEHAHRAGVIHRDLKPENVLLREGEAFLTDFGIALAVQQAGGNRLTDTGMSLGTPEYMSPEQATGDRALDARSDVYSLGAVVYEMLTGEPPHTGSTAHAVIAKLMTDRPTRVRTLRDTVSPALDAAVTKALAKLPADRYRTAEEFAAALGSNSAPAPSTARRRLAWLGAAGAAAVLIATAIALWARRPPPAPAAAYDRVQLTTSGEASSPVVSPDGAQVAYAARSCSDDGTCRVTVMLRDLASNVERPIADGFDWGLLGRWSANGSWLLVFGHPLGKPVGLYVVSRLGGRPAFVGLGDGDFTSSGDTAIVAPGFTPRPTVYLRVVPISTASPTDSIGIAAPRGATQLDNVSVAPNGQWIAVLWDRQPGDAAVCIYDRSGRLTDTTRAPSTIHDGLKWSPNSGALYLPLQSASGRGSLLRTPIAPSGKVGRQDTVFVTDADERLTDYGLSANGRVLAYASARHGPYVLWTLEQRMAGQPPQPLRRVRSASSQFGAYLTKDGRSIFYPVTVAGSAGSQLQLFVEPFDGGGAHAVTPPLSHVRYWNPTLDGRRLVVETDADGGGSRLTAYDVATQRATRFADVSTRGNIWESGLDGISMIDEAGDTLRIFDGAGRLRQRIGIPDSIGGAFHIVPSPDASEFVFWAIPPGAESDEHGGLPVGLYVVSPATGSIRLVLRQAVANFGAPMQWAADGWIYSGLEFGSQRPMLYRAKLERGSKTEQVSGLPFAPDNCNCVMASDARRWVGTVSQSTSDIYLIRNFDAVHR